MNKKDLNKLTKNKLIKQLADNEESLVNLRFQKKKYDYGYVWRFD